MQTGKIDDPNRNPTVPIRGTRSTVTWGAEPKSRSFYLDRELVGSSLYVRFTRPEEICIGGLKTWNAQAYIDELRIIKVP